MGPHLTLHTLSVTLWGFKMKVGDLVQLQGGTRLHWDLPTGIALLSEKLPRNDYLEYDWKVYVDGRTIELGRQLEQSSEVISEA